MTEYTRHVEGQSGLARAFTHMPGWKVKLVVVSLVVGIIGVGAQVASRTLRQPTPVVQTTTHVTPAPPGASGFVGGGDAGSTPSTPPQVTTDTTVTTTAPTPPTLTDQVSPYLTKFGFSFVIGLVVGVIFRTFLGLAATLTAVVVAAALALSYFGVINVDLTAVKAHTGEATSWLSEQGSHLKDLIFAHLPSTGAAGAGFLVGMKRR